MRRDRVGMQFKIKDITEQWKVSRPTVMKRIKDGKLIGEKDGSTDQGGVWTFEPDNVVRCFGEPPQLKSREEIVAESVEHWRKEPERDTSQDAVIKAKDEMISMLQGQIETKDQQLKTAQDTLQTKLLEDQRRESESSKGFFARLFK